MDRILIAGGGIGGLAAALALARAGAPCAVLESAAVMREIGAGIQLGPNAFRAFDALGLGDEVRRGAVLVDSFRLMNAKSGDPIATFSFGPEFRARFGNPYAVVHRADLHATLLSACERSGLVDLQVSHRIQGYEQDDDGVRVYLEGRPPMHGAALVGADGLHSAVRAQLVGDGRPRVSGHTTYRALIATADMPPDLRWNSMAIWVGPKCHIVHYPLKGGDLFNLVATRQTGATEPVSGEPVVTADARSVFADVAPQIRRMIQTGENWKRWVLCDRDPTERWTDGRVTLLGDAAHPTLQYFAQGACMAIEDGVALGEQVEASPEDLAAAFEAYRRSRMIRTARVVMGSRMIGDYIFHPAGAAATVRDHMMANLTNTGFRDALAWLYDGPPPPAGLGEPDRETSSAAPAALAQGRQVSPN